GRTRTPQERISLFLGRQPKALRPIALSNAAYSIPQLTRTIIIPLPRLGQIQMRSRLLVNSQILQIGRIFMRWWRNFRAVFCRSDLFQPSMPAHPVVRRLPWAFTATWIPAARMPGLIGIFLPTPSATSFIREHRIILSALHLAYTATWKSPLSALAPIPSKSWELTMRQAIILVTFIPSWRFIQEVCCPCRLIRGR